MKKFLAFALFSSSLFAQNALTTRAYDNARSGMNTQETILTQQSVKTKGVTRITTIPVMGDARGIEASPLIVPKLRIGNGTVHDTMLLCSMANICRGVDAQTGEGLWQTSVGTSVFSNATIDFHSINQHWGCLSTGVIDTDTNWAYISCQVSIDDSGTPSSGRYFMFVLDMRTGQRMFPPVNLQGLDSTMWKQRSSLLLTKINNVKTIFIAHGSVYETSTGYTGGITAFDVATHSITAQLPMTSGIWMAGQGLIADSDGYIYAITANGDFDPSKNWYGESFIKVQYSNKALTVVDQWSPWTDYARAGKPLPGTKVSGKSLPTEAAKPVGGNMSMIMRGAKVTGSMNDQGQALALVYPMASGDWSDEDWGSAGPACLMSLKVCIATGKDGIGYPISMTSLGKTTVATVGTQANYDKLSAPCAWLTASPGPIQCAPDNAQALNFFIGGNTAHMHMTPVQMYDPLLKSWVIFVWGENQQLHKWAVGPKGALTYIAQSKEYASTDSRGKSPGGMPGGFCSASSNGADPLSMLLYCTIPYGDANATITNGRLLIYDPVHLAQDGSLQVLWDSQKWGVTFTFNKFLPPVAWNGYIYVGNYNGGVDAYN